MKTLKLSLINCEINFILTWLKKLHEASRVKTFAVASTKLYVPVVTLLTIDNVKLLQQLKFSFKIITISQ